MGILDEEALEMIIRERVDQRFYTLKSELRNEIVRELEQVIKGDAVIGEVRRALPDLVGKLFLEYKDSGWFETWAKKCLEDELGRVLRNAFKVEITNMVADRDEYDEQQEEGNRV